MADQKLRGRAALITGGNTGIGRATATLFRQHGARVAVVGRDTYSLAATERELGNGCLAIQADVSKLDQIRSVMEQVGGAFERLDALVISAGVGSVVSIADTTEAQFDEMVSINFKAAFFTIQAALGVLNDGASIVLIGSMSHVKGVPGYAVYSASKAALRSLSRSAAAELLSRGIRVNTLSPGPTETSIIERMGYTRDDVRAAVAERNPMGRMATAEEIARAALFLASSDSAYMTGADLVVDGGQSQL